MPAPLTTARFNDTQWNHEELAVEQGVDLTEWDAFVHGAPSGTYYHSSAWLEAVAAGMGQTLRAHAIRDAEGRFVAGAVLRRAARWGVVRGTKPWATAYNGLVLAQGAPQEAANALVRALYRRYHEIRLVSRADDEVLALHTHRAATCTPVVHLTPFETFHHRIDRHARQHLRAARDAGVVIQETQDARTFYPLYRSSYARQRLDMPLDEFHVTATLETARQCGPVRVFVALSAQGDPAAALVTASDSKRVYFMLAGAEARLRKLNAMSLLWWHVFERYAATHAEVDLVGYGTAGIAQFKRTWRPVDAPLCDYLGYSSGWARQALAVGVQVNRIRGALCKGRT